MPPDSKATPVHDVIVVGAGIAGLTAAWTLRDLDVVLLEAEDRVGGRMRSLQSDPYWVNLGAHMFPRPGAPLSDLAEELGLTTTAIPGVTLALEMRRRVVASRNIASYPIRLPLTIRERVALARVGVRVVQQMLRYNRICRPRSGEPPSETLRSQLSFLSDRTFAQFLGDLPAGVDALFQTVSHRTPCASEDLSAGCGISMLAHVFTSSGDSALGYALDGGTEELPRALARNLGSAIRVRCPVRQVASEPDGVRVTYTCDGAEQVARARRVIVATTANAAADIVAGLPTPLEAALRGVRYGSFLSMGVFTDEPGPTRWDNVYAIATPERTFDYVFNQASPLRTGARRPGGALMVYAGGPKANTLLERTDDQIREAYERDLVSMCPELNGHIVQAAVQRWPIGNSYAGIHRVALQDALELGYPDSGIVLAGDYFTEQGSMQPAMQSGRAAAGRVRRAL